MSQIKNKILQLLKATDISGRYRTILETYKLNPEYAKLTYHNRFHVEAVLNLFEVLRKLSGKGFRKDELKAVELAITFHDIDHTGRPDSYRDEKNFNNILHAIMAFNRWTQLNRTERHVIISTQDLIEASAWPHTQMSAFGVSDELLAMMRDADILWGMMPGCAEQSMLGMITERRNFGLDEGEIKILDTLVNQINFIRNYEPQSAVGRTFKNAMFEDASNAWALAALQYQRQIEAAELVANMTDDEVLRLAAAMKGPIREMAQETVTADPQ